MIGLLLPTLTCLSITPSPQTRMWVKATWPLVRSVEHRAQGLLLWTFCPASPDVVCCFYSERVAWPVVSRVVCFLHVKPALSLCPCSLVHVCRAQPCDWDAGVRWHLGPKPWHLATGRRALVWGPGTSTRERPHLLCPHFRGYVGYFWG